MKERIYWIDNLKFIGIFCIYLGHFGKDAGALYPFVFSFHVPLFFFLSGMFYSTPASPSALFSIWVKVFKSILIPYFVFAAISLAFFSLSYDWDAKQAAEKAYTVVYGLRAQVFAGSLWFLPCLFVVIIYHSILKYILKRDPIVLAASFISFCVASKFAVLGTPTWIFNADSAFCYLAYYSVGACLSSMLKKSKDFHFSGVNVKLSNTIVAASFIFMVAVYFKGSAYFLGMVESFYLRVGASFFLTLIMIIPIVYASMSFRSDFATKLGQSTLVLCGTEQLIKLITFRTIRVFDLNLNLTNPLNTLIYTSLCFVVAYFTTVRLYDYAMREIRVRRELKSDTSRS